MLRDRTAVTLLLLPFLIWIIASGGWLYLLMVSAGLALAAAEWGLLFRREGARPAMPLLVGGVMALLVARQLGQWEPLGSVLTLLVLLVMVWHVLDYERGAAKPGSDFAISVAGIVYLGWIGGYLVSLRGLPEGQWWVLLALPTVWLADSAAYFVGKAIGRHKLSPRSSPNKTWEGYLAGVVVGALSGAGLALVWQIAAASPMVNPAVGALIGLTVAVLSPFGDLGVSMLKRQMGVKDSGSILPGHGGALDRIDSWLWAGALAYFIVVALPG